MDIDFIKWMVGYAEGFEWNEDPEGVYVTFGTGYTLDPKDIILFTGEVLYPLLLQRAIEGINNSTLDYEIMQNQCGCYLLSDEELDFAADTYDGSKERILEYIHEQEKKNGD